ncbi:hypothetical protein HAZT_HAZT008624 [Hyalella azteca]|uniref:RGS domain-containing protein n=1 Tax=Hyalella azteca TaxID=294128 RepID=A0A6A0GY80_HYAAZ|nr:hypothetical protein HAZT_HAZT008624 [Hyalella azteca]
MGRILIWIKYLDEKLEPIFKVNSRCMPHSELVVSNVGITELTTSYTCKCQHSRLIAAIPICGVTVSLDSRVRDIVHRNMRAPTPHTFDEAQSQIYTLMHRDSYPRFINSSSYKELAQLTSNCSSAGRKESTSRKDSAT